MTQPLLVLDSHYLCHRAFHTTRHLEFGGNATGVIFGFLKTISILKDEFQTDRIAFAFEHPHLLRRDIYPAYKQRRMSKEKNPEELKQLGDLSRQIKALREEYLFEIGFKNVFCFDGYEADDILASIAANKQEDEEVILVTADQDLFQCLRPNVSMYSPQKQFITDEGTFYQTYQIRPSQWAIVKSIAGCAGDEVKGIKGIGEATALKWVRRELKVTHKAYIALSSIKNRAIVRLNRKLVQLPFDGCPVPNIQEDNFDEHGWREVCAKLGMRSILSRPPIATRKLRQLEL